MLTRSVASAWVVLTIFVACGADSRSEETGEVASETASSSQSTAAGEGSESANTETSDGETGDAETPVELRWVEVSASDYKLELVPEFDASITEYLALSEGPGIEVYVDVNLDADVEGVLINETPAMLNGFRTWRSAPETGLVSPTAFTVRVQAGELAPPLYTFEVTVP